MPLAHPPGHAQVDFGECVGVIGGVRMKLHVFCFELPQSDACFLKSYAAETTEAFLDGHVSAFGFFGGVPLSILYDNTKLAVARILGDGERRRTQAFTKFVSHFLALGAVRGRTLARQSAEPRMDAGMPDSKRQLPVHTSDLPEVHEAVADPPGERGPFSTVPSTSPRTMWSISSSAKTEVSMGALARVSHELNN